MVVCASNPLSTQDDVAASLVADDEIPAFAIKGEDTNTYYGHILSALKHRPNLTMDDGADLVSSLHFIALKKWKDLRGQSQWSGDLPWRKEKAFSQVYRRHGGDDHRRDPAQKHGEDGVLQFPIISVNDADTKHLFDNRYGTGQSTVDGIIRATNRLLAGSTFVVSGYGWCGRGVAMRAKGPRGPCDRLRGGSPQGPGSGHGRLPGDAHGQGGSLGDIFCTLTGDINVIRKEHFLKYEGRRHRLQLRPF